MARPKGSQNKVTANARKALSDFIHGRAKRVVQLWDDLAERDGPKALELYSRLAEFAIPKLGRTEVTGEGGGPVVVEVVKYTEEN